MPDLNSVYLYVDASRSTITAGIGIVIVNPQHLKGKRLRYISKPIAYPEDIVSAELIAMIHGLKMIRKYPSDRIHPIVHSDNLYIVQIANKIYIPIHHLSLWDELHRLEASFPAITYHWIPRNGTRHHKQADKLARLACFGSQSIDRYHG